MANEHSPSAFVFNTARLEQTPSSVMWIYNQYVTHRAKPYGSQLLILNVGVPSNGDPGEGKLF